MRPSGQRGLFSRNAFWRALGSDVFIGVVATAMLVGNYGPER
jgi:hypothetical protein